MNHLFNDMPFCWQNLDGFITEDIPTTEPYLCELGADQHQYNPFVLSPIRPEYPCLVSDAPDSILPSPFFTELADITETTPLQFTEQYSQTRDSFLVPQYVQNMEPLHRALEIPRGTSVDSFGSNALLRSTERVDPHSEKENQILAISKSYNTNETNGANQETKKFQSPFEQYNVQSAEVFKPRMRWTPELHERFVQAINHLGGPDKTTPRSILIKMGVNGLTVDHVKSHLQKYRQAREQPEAKEEKRASCSEWKKKNSTEKDNKFLKVSTEESGTLHMQWKLQKTLHDQLKIIRELQLQTEENGRRLQKFVENQDKMREAFMQATQSLSSTCKVKNTEEPLSQACNSKEDEEILTNDLLEENCFVQSNFESNVPFHKKARLDI